MYNIIIADDERLERSSVKKIIETEFNGTCLPYEAENGRKAIDLLENVPIDIAILDIKMPGLSGIDVARYIKTKYPMCKIIMLTGFTYFSFAKECITIGVMEFLVKPYLKEELIESIKKAIEYLKENTDEKENFAEIQKPANKNWVVQIEKEIKNKFTQDLSMEYFAKIVGFSPYYFSRMFKQEFKVNFVDYITHLRLEKACELLSQTEMCIKEVCFEVGYSEPNYFTRVFKKTYGIAPTQYQKNAIMSKKS